MSQKPSKPFMEDDFDEDYDENSQEDKFLTFRIAEEDYGIEIQHVIEIVGMQKITEVPDVPSFVKGVINLRGNIIPIVDIRLRFQMNPRPYDDRTCIIVVHIREMAIGLVVDTVKEVIAIPPDFVSPPPKVHKTSLNRFIQGIGKAGDSVQILLAVDTLLFDEDLNRLEKNEAVHPSQGDFQ